MEGLAEVSEPLLAEFITKEKLLAVPMIPKTRISNQLEKDCSPFYIFKGRSSSSESTSAQEKKVHGSTMRTSFSGRGIVAYQQVNPLSPEKIIRATKKATKSQGTETKMYRHGHIISEVSKIANFRTSPNISILKTHGYHR